MSVHERARSVLFNETFSETGDDTQRITQPYRRQTLPIAYHKRPPARRMWGVWGIRDERLATLIHDFQQLLATDIWAILRSLPV